MGKWDGKHIEVGRKAEIQSHHKPHPRHSDPQSGRNSKPEASPWRVKGLYPIPGTPMFKRSTWDETQNIWLWKQAGLTPIRHMGLWWVLKGFTCRPTHLRAQCRNSLKTEKELFANFKALDWGERSCWDTLWGKKLVDAIFLFSLYLPKANGYHHFFSLFVFFPFSSGQYLCILPLLCSTLPSSPGQSF